MMRLYFFRHGQTDYNLQNIVQGGGIDSDLNQTGQQQARAFYEAYRHLPFDAVYASPLKRTHQTLAPWQQDGYQFRIEPGLQEFNWGIHEGKKPTPEEHAAFKAVLRRWMKGELHVTVEQGETLFQAWQRAEPFFQILPERHAGEQVLLCSHGRQLRILLCNLLQEDLSQMEKFKHDNTGLTIVEWEARQKPRLVKLNDTSHLSQINV